MPPDPVYTPLDATSGRGEDGMPSRVTLGKHGRQMDSPDFYKPKVRHDANSLLGFQDCLRKCGLQK